MTSAPPTITLLATSVDPPAICPGCGDALALDHARCARCRYERSRACWRREPLPELRRGALVEGAVTALIGALCAAPALIALGFGVARGSEGGALLGLALLAIAALFLWLGVARLRSVGRPARWSYRDEDVEVSSDVDPVSLGLALRGARAQRALLTVDARWAAIEPSDRTLDALLAARSPEALLAARTSEALPVDPVTQARLRSVARGALALARLASLGAIQLVERRFARWSARHGGARVFSESCEVSLARGHSVVSDEPLWNTERALLAAFERALGDDEASVAPTAEARHYREAQLRAGVLREVDLDDVLTMLVAPPLEGPLEPRPLPWVLDSLRERELRVIPEPAADEALWAALDRDRAVFVQWFERFAARVFAADAAYEFDD